MRATNKNLTHIQYSGKMDKGGNDQQLMRSRYFKPFNNSNNLQIHGKIPSGISMVGGVGISVEPYSKTKGQRYTHTSVANME